MSLIKNIRKAPRKEVRKIQRLIRENNPSASLASSLAGIRGRRRKSVYRDSVESTQTQLAIDAAFQFRFFWSESLVTVTRDGPLFHTTKACPAFMKIEPRYFRSGNTPPVGRKQCHWCSMFETGL